MSTRCNGMATARRRTLTWKLQLSPSRAFILYHKTEKHFMSWLKNANIQGLKEKFHMKPQSLNFFTSRNIIYKQTNQADNITAPTAFHRSMYLECPIMVSIEYTIVYGHSEAEKQRNNTYPSIIGTRKQKKVLNKQVTKKQDVISLKCSQGATT